MNKKTEKTSAQHWNNLAKLWAESIRSGKDVFRDLYNLPAFLKFVGNIKDKQVLDVGCGEGDITRIFAKLGASITGVDLSENMIHFAQEEENKNPLGINYKIASWTKLSVFKNESFDTVISTMALMDGPGYKEALQEFNRVLKNDGNLFFSITHPCFLTPGYTKIKDEHGQCTHRVVTTYFKEGPWEFKWELSKEPNKSNAQQFTSMAYHRTISTYINNLIEAGFTLKKIEEPKPSDKACEENPRLKIARDVAPSFLFVHAVKKNVQYILN